MANRLSVEKIALRKQMAVDYQKGLSLGDIVAKYADNSLGLRSKQGVSRALKDLSAKGYFEYKGRMTKRHSEEVKQTVIARRKAGAKCVQLHIELGVSRKYISMATKHLGSAKHGRKLTDEQVREIRAKSAAKVPAYHMWRHGKYGVSYPTIRNVASGRLYKEVTT